MCNAWTNHAPWKQCSCQMQTSPRTRYHTWWVFIVSNTISGPRSNCLLPCFRLSLLYPQFLMLIFRSLEKLCLLPIFSRTLTALQFFRNRSLYLLVGQGVAPHPCDVLVLFKALEVYSCCYGQVDDLLCGIDRKGYYYFGNKEKNVLVTLPVEKSINQ